MKKITPIITGSLVALFAGIFIAHAQSYAPLAPLPGTYTGTVGSETTNMSTYLAGAIKLIIALGAGLAVLVAIVGGTQYVAAGASPDAKSGAKERIFSAFIGLALVLTSYLILNSINPDLVNFKLELPPIKYDTTLTLATSTISSPGTGVAWPSDGAERFQLTTGGVAVKSPICTQVGQTGCTSVYGLPNNAIQRLIALKKDCGCDVFVTSGTEYWQHKTHGGPGYFASVVDLRTTPSLGAYVNSHTVPDGTFTRPQSGCGLQDADHYQVIGPGAGTYVLENPGTGNVHWHVCY